MLWIAIPTVQRPDLPGPVNSLMRAALDDYRVSWERIEE
jgi:hypothetical protein